MNRSFCKRCTERALDPMAQIDGTCRDPKCAVGRVNTRRQDRARALRSRRAMKGIVGS